MAVGISIIRFNDTGIAGLEIFTTRRLDLDNGFCGRAGGCTVSTVCAICALTIGGRLSRVGHVDRVGIDVFVRVIGSEDGSRGRGCGGGCGVIAIG